MIITLICFIFYVQLYNHLRKYNVQRRFNLGWEGWIDGRSWLEWGRGSIVGTLEKVTNSVKSLPLEVFKYVWPFHRFYGSQQEPKGHCLSKRHFSRNHTKIETIIFQAITMTKRGRPLVVLAKQVFKLLEVKYCGSNKQSFGNLWEYWMNLDARTTTTTISYNPSQSNANLSNSLRASSRPS